jgi:hypothetical protein
MILMLQNRTGQASKIAQMRRFVLVKFKQHSFSKKVCLKMHLMALNN